MELHKTTIVCIRHGESEANVHLHKDIKGKSETEIIELIKSSGDDPELTDKGKAQAKSTSDYLEPILTKVVDTDYVMLFTSELKRAQQTASFLKQTESQPLYITKLQVLPEMKEYNKEEYVEVATFIDQIFRLFAFLQHKSVSAVEPQTIILVGHSLAFSTLFTIFAFHQKGIDPVLHKKLVSDRLTVEGKPKYLNTFFELPNCSISVAQAVPEAIPRLDNPKRNDIQLTWKILGLGKIDHLDTSLKTGIHSPF